MNKGNTLLVYSATATAVIAAMICFDALWGLTQMQVQDCMAISMFVAMGIGIVFALAGEWIAGMDRNIPARRSMFIDSGGLNVLIQQSSHTRNKKRPNAWQSNQGNGLEILRSIF